MTTRSQRGSGVGSVLRSDVNGDGVEDLLLKCDRARDRELGIERRDAGAGADGDRQTGRRIEVRAAVGIAGQ